LSFGELEDAVARLAEKVRSLPPGIAMIEARPRIPTAIAMLALLRAKKPLAVMAEDWTEAEKATRRALLGRCTQINESGEIVWASEAGEAAHHPETGLVLFTSGSTGGARAVQLSARGMQATIETVIDILDFAETAEQTLFLPLSYSFGFLGHLLPALRAGVPTRLLAGVAEARVELERGTARGMWSGVPSHWQALLDLTGVGPGNPVGLSHIVTAGDHMSFALRRRVHEAFPEATIYNNYGQTEAGPRILCFTSRHPDFFERGDGFAVGDFELRLEDDGELCARGTPLMLGYMGNQEASARRIDAGWLRTGDIAEIDDEGLVTILGRKDNLINVGGERVSLQEVEAALRRLDGVADAAVFVEDDETYGRALVGLLVGDALAATGRREIIERLSRELSWKKIPRRYYSVEGLKRSEQGKLIRSDLPRPGTDAVEIR
jgi:long-chain acyl-CoA synthetase